MRSGRERLIDIWRDWERSYREPVGGWAGYESFEAWWVSQRDALAQRVVDGTPASLASDVTAVRRWVAAGGELRIGLRGVDNMARARVRLLADLDALIATLAGEERTVMRQINLRVSDELLEAIERMRGRVSRERFVRAILERHALYYDGDESFDAERYVAFAETPALRDRQSLIAVALDEHRGDTPRSLFLSQLIEGALGLDDRGNTVTTE